MVRSRKNERIVLLIREKVALNTKMGGCYFECGKLNFLSIRLKNILETKAVLQQPDRIDQDLKLLFKSAPGVYLGDPGQRNQSRPYQKILRQSGTEHSAARAGNHIMKNFPQPGCNRTQLGSLDTGGHFHGLKTFQNQRTCLENISTVFENQRHLILQDRLFQR